jgi:PAS domain S-box-containing protein
MKKEINIKLNPGLNAIVVFVLFFLVVYIFLDYEDDAHEKEIRDNLFRELVLKKSDLERALSSRINYTKGIATYVSLNPEITREEYEHLTGKLILGDSLIHTMSLAKGGIINAIYPSKGNEEVLGLNLLEHKDRKKIVEETIRTKKAFVSGPVELVEGGLAFISYHPIFLDLNDGSELFWGVTDIVIKEELLFEEAGISQHENGLKFALRGKDGKGMNGEIFWGDVSVFSDSPVQVDVLLPIGSWVLACVPDEGWNSYMGKSTLDIVLYTVVALLTAMVYLLSRAWNKLTASESKLKAIFSAMNDIIIEFDENCVYKAIAPTREELLIRPKEGLLNKSVYQVFSREMADAFYNNVRTCLETKKPQFMEYPLLIEGNKKWFSARISYINSKRALFVAHDSTDSKMASENLIKSEASLKELNGMKDKIFSIIAHDLKNPLGTYMQLTSMILSDYDKISDVEKKSILKQLVQSSKTLYSLLENLLDWSRSQRGHLPYNPELNDLHFIAKNVKSVLKLNAKQKGIKIKNKVEEFTLAYFDANMIITVLRNLVSNSIKYCHHEGEIEIGVKQGKDMKSATMWVKDNGIGIPEKQLNKLFKIDQNVTTPGTNDEQGTGLGLILCKDFVKKNGGDIWAKSEEGKGTVFYFTLPLAPEE